MMSPTCFFLFFFQRAGCFLVVLCCVVFSVTAAAAAAETMAVGIGLFGEWLGWALSSRAGPASSYTRSHDGVSSSSTGKREENITIFRRDGEQEG